MARWKDTRRLQSEKQNKTKIEPKYALAILFIRQITHAMFTAYGPILRGYYEPYYSHDFKD
jgi:hypothetical protein